MTNAQKWVSIFLLLFVILLVLSKLTKRDETQQYDEIDETNYSQTEPELPNEIEILLTENQCKNCHGKNLEGSDSGPSLHRVSQKWSSDDLFKYLQDPKSFNDNPRISEYKGKYRFSMPPAEKLSEEKLNILVNYLLTEY
ncbi:MAG: cytochrome c [Bacteroidota bacterium]